MRAAIALLAALPVVGLLVAAGLTEAATTPSAVISTDSAWGSGYQDKVTITTGSSAITSWKVEFDLPAGSSMGSYWDALDAPSGQHQVFTNREYNGSLAAGASTTFGFLVSGSGQPVNCKINGQPCAGGSTPPTTTTTTTTTTTGTPPPVGAKFSPYVDITSATPTLADVARATGQKSFNLAFALADSTGCTVSWGGTIPLNDARIIGEVNDLKALGGSVTVSTGGAAGPYLENTCGSAAALTAAYEKALDAVGSNSLDVDIEASIPTAMVNQALLAVQQARGTTISYTLRVQAQDYGIDPFSVSILQDAASRGVNVLVNPMVMDFGFTGDWGQAMVSAANATLGQMKSIWPSKSDAQLRASLGLTPMIGVNDSGMVTTKAAAQTVLSFAQSNHIGRLAFWSVGRDNGNCPSGGVSPSCSGISQSLYDFVNLYKGFNG
jgi:chitinase